jgi:quinol-cytochrome oxidoreductase complex cytochrome b subunit/mono/diheme cytochrome c family protein
VIGFIREWVDDRTGLGKVIDAMLLEHIPGGARWRYVWGSALAIVFSIQMITGVLLMTAYSPGDTTAWSSVYFIQYEMDFGWLIRGLHHFGSQTMVVLLGLHMLQVVIAGAHLKPREVNWWLGLGLAGVVLGLSLTGYLLPWDQKGFYATQVATNIAGGLPVIGQFIQKVVVGGPAYGNHTLTRFFGLHVAILPGILIAMLIAHIWVFRRHGITTPRNATGEGWFWPDQAFRDMVIGLIILGIMFGLVIYGWGNKIEPTANADGVVPERSFYDKIAHAGRDGRGANLDAPADPNTPYPARPEWYFLSLFQLLKHFDGLTGTVFIPGGIALILFLLPLLGHGKLRPLVHIASVFLVLALLGSAAYLTGQAWVEDQRATTLEKKPYSTLKDVVAKNRYDADKAGHFQDEMEAADKRAKRAIQLASDGIPAAGPRYLLRNDPMTAGKKLFKDKCATCHNYRDPEPEKPSEEWMNKEPTASDLTDFGTKEWIKGLLTNADDPKYFGLSHLKGGKMTKEMDSKRGKVPDPQKRQALEAELDSIAEWLAGHPRKEVPTEGDKSPFAEGYRKFVSECISCHNYRRAPGEEIVSGPDFTGYGDAEWIRGMIVDPAGKTRYGKNNRMPAFDDLSKPGGELVKERLKLAREDAIEKAGDDADAKKKAEKAFDQTHKIMNLSDLERELIVRFMTHDGRVVFGGETIGGAPLKK